MAYLKNGLPPDQRQAIAVHLAGCDVCAQALAEIKWMEAEITAESTHHRPTLTPEASLRIQKQLYRRMRRSLVLQRTRGIFQMAGATIIAILFFGGALAFGNQWVQFLAKPEGKVNSGQLAVSSEQSAVNSEQGAVNSDPTHSPFTIHNSPFTIPSPLLPGAPPSTVARLVLEAALTQDKEALSILFSAMHTIKDPTLNLWLRFGRRCGGSLLADSLEYKTVPHESNGIVRVELWGNGRFLGDLKLRQLNGEWYTVFAPTPYCSLSTVH